MTDDQQYFAHEHKGRYPHHGVGKNAMSIHDVQPLSDEELSRYREVMENYAPDKPSVRLLTTLDVTQAELNRSQAHNALLLDALKKAEPYTYRITDGKPNRTTLICKTAIDVTGPAIKAWLEERDKKAVEAFLGAGAYADVCKQLATMTAARDEGVRIATEYQALYKIAASERDALMAILAIVFIPAKTLKDGVFKVFGVKPAEGEPPHKK